MIEISTRGNYFFFEQQESGPSTIAPTQKKISTWMGRCNFRHPTPPEAGRFFFPLFPRPRPRRRLPTTAKGERKKREVPKKKIVERFPGKNEFYCDSLSPSLRFLLLGKRSLYLPNNVTNLVATLTQTKKGRGTEVLGGGRGCKPMLFFFLFATTTATTTTIHRRQILCALREEWANIPLGNSPQPSRACFVIFRCMTSGMSDYVVSRPCAHARSDNETGAVADA
jgi:hypothetical protein